MARKKIQTMVMEGTLTQAEALQALSMAAQSATDAMPYALLKCKDHAEMQKIIADRDACLLAYTNAMRHTLQHTGPLFEKTAKELTAAAKAVNRKVKTIKDAAEAVELLANLVRVAAKLALAFV
ncbi:MAG: hypothetical protein PHO37_05805 [Kiritimatiellae bacterium]|nr:hypothetical protein [Kiritimatiellia bacterium]